MANLNKVLLIGRLTRDPELRYMPSGTAVAELGLAVNREYKDQSGEKKEVTCFVDLVAYGRRGEVLHEYMKKGQQLFVEGRLDFDTWESKQGEKRSRHRVFVENFQFLGGGQGQGSGGGQGQGSGGRSGGGDFSRGSDPAAPETTARERTTTEPKGGGDDPFDLGDLPF
jgi:single-strand DNA-binding protein